VVLLPIGLAEGIGLKHSEGAAAKELGPAHRQVAGETVEAFHQIVVQLHQDLPARHEHMVIHMKRLGKGTAHPTRWRPYASPPPSTTSVVPVTKDEASEAR
jgi:hypothetical protein